MRELKVDARSAVRRVVVTHWHDDHIRGIAQVVRDCAEADFVCPAVRDSCDIKRRRQKQSCWRWKTDCCSSVIGPRNHRGFKLWALSPSDAAIRWALASLATEIPQPMASKIAVSPPTPNHLSIALLAQLEDRVMLLRADVHCSDNRSLGWLRIADIHKEYGHTTAEVLKVPHHGSSNSDTAELWDRLVVSQPIAALTPFCRGSVSLPKGRRKNKCRFWSCASGPGTDGVVAQRLGLVRFEGDGSELRVGDLDTVRIILVNQLGVHP